MLDYVEEPMPVLRWGQVFLFPALPLALMALGAAVLVLWWTNAPGASLIAANCVIILGACLAMMEFGMRYARNRGARDLVLARDLLGEADRSAVLTDTSGIILEGAGQAGRIQDMLARHVAEPERMAAELLRRLEQEPSRFVRHRLASHGAELQLRRAGHDMLLWRILPLDDVLLDSAVRVPLMELDEAGQPIRANGCARSLLQNPEALPDLRANPARVNLRGTSFRPSRLNLPTGQELLALLPVQTDDDEIDVPLEAIDIPVPLMRLRPDGTIRDANSHARRLIGQARPEGTSLEAYLTGHGTSLASWLHVAVKTPQTNHSEFLRLKTVEHETFIQVTLSRMADSDDSDLIIVMSDATELKSLEMQFVQSQKMQAIGQLAGGIAHDFNNLLTAISGHCDLLLMRYDEGDPEYPDLIQINQNANRAAALVGQLLAFSRKQNLVTEVLDLRHILADLAHLLNRLVGEKTRLVLDQVEDLPPIQADRRQLEQVVMNLVLNARDAMPDGGDIVIRSERLKLATPWYHRRQTIPPADYIRFTVTDQGMGIPADKLETVFEPFYTTKRTGEGTGLGLSTAYGIVRQSGGFIFADSVEGSGSTFTVLFRVATKPAAAAPQSPAKPGAKIRRVDTNGVVLLVEDEAPVRAFASRALRMSGLMVIEADCGEAALEILEDRELEIDLIVTDVIMPGMDGPTWVTEARQHRPDVPVIFVSGYPEDVFEREDAQLPNADFLPKPFSLQALTQAVTERIAPPQSQEIGDDKVLLTQAAQDQGRN